MQIPPSLPLHESYQWCGFQPSSISLVFSTDGRILASLSLDCSVKLFDVTSGHPICSILLDAGIYPLVLHWTDKNEFLLSTSDALVSYWTVDAKAEKVTLRSTVPHLFPSAIHHMSTHFRAKELLVLAVYDNSCEVFQFTKGVWKPRARVTGGGLILAAQFLSDNIVFVAFREGPPQFWNVTANSLSNVSGWSHATRIHSVSFHAPSTATKLNQDGNIELVVFRDDDVQCYRVIMQPLAHLQWRRTLGRFGECIPSGKLVKWGERVTLVSCRSQELLAFDLDPNVLTPSNKLASVVTQTFTLGSGGVNAFTAFADSSTRLT
ncbi:hypothetical protein AURDEDRAFT_174784 [Auricularia subglabra TFB-10046 SS5]|uniref:WD40 repeat-like protein n=1 Tax=Auricularia subglabra (strain TFB-10046 / SS5) TaxID=717982 RepID=J0WU22_AURST|nr:hypothetical protein AURDEDRAFT_174784 [Auricularia subglabra TFB-10046 SS5]